MREVEYLGDAVYVYRDQWERIWLATKDGIRTTNEICLEPEVLAKFLDYIGVKR